MHRRDFSAKGWSGGLVFGALLLAAAPHALHLPFWVTASSASMLLAGAFLKRPFPALLRLFLVAGAITGIASQFGRVWGRDAGSALLVLMLGLKALEVRGKRDLVVLVFLGYFLVLAQFLYSQSLPMLLHMTLSVWMLTASLAAVHHPLGLRKALHLSGRLLLQAIPLTLLLFILFPRVPGPLWGLPPDAHAGITGFSEDMSPGSLTHLATSDAVAFRVDFHGPVPPASLRYFRGPVLWHTDGRHWQRTRLSHTSIRMHPEGKAMRYTMTLEPYGKRWLFPLDYPADIPPLPGSKRQAASSEQRAGRDKVNRSPTTPFAFLTPDLQLLAGKPIDERLRYTLVSYPKMRRSSPLSAEERRLGLQLPEGKHPKAIALGASWGRHLKRGEAIVEAALRLFREEPFVYTLSPPPLEGDTVDEFLFETRRGYCEHYAAAFTVLMRAAGIPARVVVGYQGGEYNPLGDYLMVRQKDAHAWSEVYLHGNWVRVDPTLAVAPERVERGIEALTPPTGRLLPAWTSGFSRYARLAWDTLNNAWNQWVLSYGPKRQKAFLSSLGWDSWRAQAMALGAGMAILLGLLTLHLLRRQAPGDPVQQAYRRFCRKLARKGLEKRPREGPLDYARRVAKAFPEKGRQVETITRYYIALRYGPSPRVYRVDRLKRLVARFRV